MYSSWKIFFFVIGLLSLAAGPARADYGLIPNYENLTLKAGTDLYFTGENYLSDGTLAYVLYQNQPASLSDLRFWVEPEYGIAEDWSVLLHMGFVTDSLGSQTSGGQLLSGSGLGDIWLATKWRLSASAPLLTIEGAVKFPTYTMVPAAADGLSLGDGNVDLAFKLHAGYETSHFLFLLSPGLLVRFGGYSTAGTIDAAIQYQIPGAYFRLFSDFLFSFDTGDLLLDTSPDIHDAPGSGGSYARLSGSPTGIYIGGKVGVGIVRSLMFETAISQAVGGNRYPNFFQVTADFSYSFDFFKPEVHKKLREIPLGEKPQEF